MYSFDAHLRCEDHEIFSYEVNAKSRRRTAQRVAEDIIRDLKGHGYLKRDGEVFVDHFQKATTILTIKATDAGVTVPAGTPFGTIDPQDLNPSGGHELSLAGDTVFVTQSELILAADATGTVEARAEHSGTPYNVDKDCIRYAHVELSGIASVTNLDVVDGGVDHQLTRAATYLTMSMMYLDYVRGEDDVFDYKRKLYMKMYRDEIKRLVAAGLEVDRDGDGVMSEAEEAAGSFGFHRFERG